jgi:hypothetical protein
MDWFYVFNNQQCGPVTETQLEELQRAGTVTLDTLVWREGQAEWQPLRVVRTQSVPTGPPPLVPGAAGMEICVECRQPFAKADLVFLNHSWVCGKCKPVFLQRMMEGASPAQPGLVWRSNRRMVLRSQTPMPDRCVQCNAPANGFRLKRQLSWHHPALYLLLFLNLLIYAIVAVIVRKKARIDIGLCESHRRKRKTYMAISWGSALIGIALICAAAAGYGGMLALLGVVLLLGGAILGAAKVVIVSATKIDKDLVWVKGAGKSFLAELQEWSGPA